MANSSKPSSQTPALKNMRMVPRQVPTYRLGSVFPEGFTPEIFWVDEDDKDDHGHDGEE